MEHHVGSVTWGKRVAGLRVKLAAAPVAVVRGLLENAWRRKAPEMLAKT